MGLSGVRVPCTESIIFHLVLQMLVDDIGDVTVTNDGATILKLLEVEHPAAKVTVCEPSWSVMCYSIACIKQTSHVHTVRPAWTPHLLCGRVWLAMYLAKQSLRQCLLMQILVELAELQDQEVGDGTTSVVILAAELLKRANDLVRNKIHPTSIISGYRLAMKEVSTPDGYKGKMFVYL